MGAAWLSEARPVVYRNREKCSRSLQSAEVNNQDWCAGGGDWTPIQWAAGGEPEHCGAVGAGRRAFGESQPAAEEFQVSQIDMPFCITEILPTRYQWWEKWLFMSPNE